MRRAALYLRVSTDQQTTMNQERELRTAAARMGCEIESVYTDQGISGAKGRDQRPQFDALCRAATRREFDVVMAWSVDRLSRSVTDLCNFLTESHASRLTCICIPRGSTPRLRWAKPCFRSPVCLQSSSAQF